MGTDFRDIDNDGRPDIALTALSGETFLLFHNRGDGSFSDATYGSRLGPLSRVYSGWGMGIVDLDNDGAKDLFTANSHVNDRVEAFEATEYRQHNSVFRNLGGGKFDDVTQGAGAAFLSPFARTGAARSRTSTAMDGSTWSRLRSARRRRSGATPAPERTRGSR